ncbi:hypothetical protein GCM10008937_24060 [Deinococcus depolymerans]|uniref:Uncharacterized protein n=1 Tax=Deinococcus depolymerans TaxID=392408 RepID=A0ABN1CB29_9DEIO
MARSGLAEMRVPGTLDTKKLECNYIKLKELRQARPAPPPDGLFLVLHAEILRPKA